MRLLASDLDGTLIPLEKEKRYFDAIAKLSAALQQHQKEVVYVTGRRLSLTLDAIREFSLPSPNYLITDVGTSIYTKENDDWILDSLYSDALRTSWKGQLASDLATSIPVITGLTPQEEDCQGEFKLSYYLDLGIEFGKVEKMIRDSLRDSGLDAQLIYSVDSIRQRGLVDILPPEVSKCFALKFLLERLGVDSSSVVFAGDSGNDKEIFLSGISSILVANTPEDLKNEVLADSDTRGYREQIFLARSKYAEGVIEGCRHFDLLPEVG